MFLSIEPERYFWGPLLTDFLTGAASCFAILMAALPLGGFVFFTPYFIVTPLVMFLAGLLRGPSFGNTVGKAVAMNLPILLLLILSLRGTTLLNTSATILATALATVLCSGAGISVRRRNTSQPREHGER